MAGSPWLTWHPQEEVRSTPAQGLSPTVLSMLVALGLLQRCRAHLSTSVSPAARHHGPSLEWGIYRAQEGRTPPAVCRLVEGADSRQVNQCTGGDGLL